MRATWNAHWLALCLSRPKAAIEDITDAATGNIPNSSIHTQFTDGSHMRASARILPAIRTAILPMSTSSRSAADGVPEYTADTISSPPKNTTGRTARNAKSDGSRRGRASSPRAQSDLCTDAASASMYTSDSGKNDGLSSIPRAVAAPMQAESAIWNLGWRASVTASRNTASIAITSNILNPACVADSHAGSENMNTSAAPTPATLAVEDENADAASSSQHSRT